MGVVGLEFASSRVSMSIWLDEGVAWFSPVPPLTPVVADSRVRRIGLLWWESDVHFSDNWEISH